MNKKILFLTLISALSLPLFASAACDLCVTIVQSIENVALLVGGGVVVVMWIVAGILFLTAAGAPEKLGAAKKGVLYAIIGTALVIVAAGAINLVGQIIGVG